MIEVTPTPEENKRACFHEAKLGRTIAAIRENGFVVVNDVIDRGHLDATEGVLWPHLLRAAVVCAWRSLTDRV